METQVVHVLRDKYDVYVGRPSIWGNPYPLNSEGERESVISRYEHWLRSRPDLVLRAKQVLRGKRLACWCSPKPCHADVLARIAEEG